MRLLPFSFLLLVLRDRAGLRATMVAADSRKKAASFYMKTNLCRSALRSSHNFRSSSDGGTDRPTSDHGLIFTALFSCMATCLRMIRLRQWKRSAEARKTERLPLPPPIGAWCWKRKVNRPQHRKHWRNFAALIGDLFTVLFADKATGQKKRKISPRVFLRCYWSAAIWMLFARRKDVCVLIC